MQANLRTNGLEINELSIINKYLTKLAISLKKNGLKGSEIEKILEEERERIFKDIEFFEKINKPINVFSIVKKHALEAGISPSEFMQTENQVSDYSLYFNSKLYWLMRLKSKFSNNFKENAPWNFIVITELILVSIVPLLFVITQNYLYLMLGLILQGLIYYLISRNEIFLLNNGFTLIFTLIFLIVNFVFSIYSLKPYFNILRYYPFGSFYANPEIIQRIIIQVLNFSYSNLFSALFLLINGILLVNIINLIFTSFFKIKTKPVSPLLYFMLYHMIILTLFLTPIFYFNYDAGYILWVAIFYGAFLFKDVSSFSNVLEKFTVSLQNPFLTNNINRELLSPQNLSHSLQNNQLVNTTNSRSMNHTTLQYNEMISNGGKIFFADLLKIDPSVISFIKITINRKKMKKTLKYPLKFYFALFLSLLVDIFAFFTLYSFNYYFGLENIFESSEEASLTRWIVFIALILDVITLLYYLIKNLEISKIKNVLIQLSIIDGKVIPVDSIKAPPLMSQAEYYNLLRELILSETVKIEVQPNYLL